MRRRGGGGGRGGGLDLQHLHGDQVGLGGLDADVVEGAGLEGEVLEGLHIVPQPGGDGDLTGLDVLGGAHLGVGHIQGAGGVQGDHLVQHALDGGVGHGLAVEQLHHVAGVEAVNSKTGETVIVRAKKVILATGGFATNPGMIQQFVPDSSDPSVSEPIWLRSALVDGRTGDGINMAMRVGGATAGMSQVVGNAPYQPDRPPINQFNGEDWLKQGRCALAQPWLWIDRNGERFFNESRGSVFT